MAAAALKPVYLLAGSDRPKIERALHRLRERIGEDAVEHLHAADTSGEAAVAACNALGFFTGDGRLVIVDEVSRWKAADVRAVAAYLGDPAPGTVLALVADDLKADAPLAKACAKAGDVLVYNVVKRKLPDWVREQFGRLGLAADRAACELLVETVGEDVTALAAEIDKLATWAAGDPVTADDVAHVAAPTAELPIYALTDAWGRRDAAAALAACETMLERTSESRSRALSRVAASLAAHVERVRACQSLAAEGARPRDAAAKLGMHSFAAEKAFAQAGNFSADELASAVVRLSRLDRALKGESKLTGELELERALVEITTPAGPRRAVAS